MSPAKKSLKTVALPIAKLRFTNVPRISQGCYRSWLGTLMNQKPNQKLMLKPEKDVIDQCFREQAMQEYALESNTLKRALADVDQNDSKALWSRLRLGFGRHSPRATEGTSLDMAAMEVVASKGRRSCAWCFISRRVGTRDLREFRSTSRTTEPGYRFHQGFDGCGLGKAVSRLSAKVAMKGRVNGLLTRCLGKESTEY